MSVNVTKYMPQKCQIWQICGYQVCFSSSKYSKTRFRHTPSPIYLGAFGALVVTDPQHKFLATPMRSLMQQHPPAAC